jgi:hypothetical protein
MHDISCSPSKEEDAVGYWRLGLWGEMALGVYGTVACSSMPIAEKNRQGKKHKGYSQSGSDFGLIVAVQVRSRLEVEVGYQR